MTRPGLAVVSFAVALVATPVMIVVASRTGIVDRPGALKPQQAPGPLPRRRRRLRRRGWSGRCSGRPSVLVPLAVALALGVADDRFDLSPRVRLVGQVAVGVAVVGDRARPPRRACSAGVLIVAVTVLLINGVNLIDGLDLLAGGVWRWPRLSLRRRCSTAPAGSWPWPWPPPWSAFLVYNRPPARVYLGDGGSYLLGRGPGRAGGRGLGARA